MGKTSLLRATSAAVVVGAGITLAPLALAAPASAALPCVPGTAAYPPGVCTYGFAPFGFPITVTTSGNFQVTIVFGQPPVATLGFGDTFFFVFGPPPGAAAAQGKQVTPTSVSVNAQGQRVVTFNKADIPADATAVTVQSAPAASSGGAASSAAPASVVAAALLPPSGAAGASAPNRAAIAQDAVAPKSLITSTVNPATGGNGYLLPIALVGGVVVAAGAVTVIRRRRTS